MNEHDIEDDDMEELDEKIQDMTALESFYHIFTIGKHKDETDMEYRERKIARETFEQMLEQNGITPSQYLAELIKRGDITVH